MRSENNEFRSEYHSRGLGEIVVDLTSGVARTTVCYDLGFISIALKGKIKIVQNLFL